jgi:DNA-binding MarR family transcriptional regulator
MKADRATVARTSLENRALLAARELVDRMRAMYRELEQLTGAPIGLHRALVCIGSEPGLPASQLASRLGMRRPAVSQVLKSLAMRGWIERRRADTDQRAVQIYTTAAGRQILGATAGRAVFTLQRAVSRLPPAQLRQFAASVELLLTFLPESSIGAMPRRKARGKKQESATTSGRLMQAKRRRQQG